MTRRRAASVVVTGIVLLAMGSAAVALRGSKIGGLSADAPFVPTARVTRGSLELTVHTTGDLRASRSANLQAPTVSGGTLRLVKMTETGTPVHAGDVIMEFDPTEQQYAIEQARSELLEAEQEIMKLRADNAVQAAQDQMDFLTARFDVRRAELDAIPDRDLIAANEYQKRQLSLDEAKRRLTQVEERGKSRGETSRASLAVAEERRTKSKMAADRAQRNIDSLIVKSPIDGFVVGRENRDGSGGFMFGGMTLPAYRAGDNVFPGRPVADVFDISQMDIRAKVNEQVRNNVAVGQSAAVQSDALPGVPIAAIVKSVSGSAQSDWWGSSGPLRDFDVTLRIDRPDPRLRPGTSVRLVMAGTHVDNVLHVPRQAVFEKNGKPIVYVRLGDRFEARTVKPTHRTESRVALEGLNEGAEIALVNPERVAKTSAKPATSPPGASK